MWYTLTAVLSHIKLGLSCAVEEREERALLWLRTPLGLCSTHDSRLTACVQCWPRRKRSIEMNDEHSGEQDMAVER
ncbi:hypothetical protein K435DRAFT_255158 [Dendrothele bispora CBS 962.96]|uniref:Secreted protein n=1 Tax=Dendrothele bispora (strain CBS 962.96) TaxID=1314807 RepID=A0A4S8LMS3_DENBC|nr:hypothetical protein K435DRAFT_255158 [Dendrothele bispora CBS 962.96]